jgi:hypothetical protein
MMRCRAGLQGIMRRTGMKLRHKGPVMHCRAAAWGLQRNASVCPAPCWNAAIRQPAKSRQTWCVCVRRVEVQANTGMRQAGKFRVQVGTRARTGHDGSPGLHIRFAHSAAAQRIRLGTVRFLRRDGLLCKGGHRKALAPFQHDPQRARVICWTIAGQSKAGSIMADMEPSHFLELSGSAPKA